MKQNDLQGLEDNIVRIETIDISTVPPAWLPLIAVWSKTHALIFLFL